VTKGQKGEVGATGSTGDKGQKGQTGDTGSTGAQGDKGQKGQEGSPSLERSRKTLGTLTGHIKDFIMHLLEVVVIHITKRMGGIISE
jgi:hypothetical protein